MSWVNLHFHIWQDSAVNLSQIAHEQHCSICKTFRHRWLDIDRTKYEGKHNWRAGQHPKAEQLRKSGKLSDA